MGARPSLLLFESANPRHAHEVQLFTSFIFILNPKSTLFKSKKAIKSWSVFIKILSIQVDVFKALKDNIPQEKVQRAQSLVEISLNDQVLVPGVIDSTTNFIEHPALVARLILAHSSTIFPYYLGMEI